MQTWGRGRKPVPGGLEFSWGVYVLVASLGDPRRPSSSVCFSGFLFRGAGLGTALVLGRRDTGRALSSSLVGPGPPSASRCADTPAPLGESLAAGHAGRTP